MLLVLVLCPCPFFSPFATLICSIASHYLFFVLPIFLSSFPLTPIFSFPLKSSCLSSPPSKRENRGNMTRKMIKDAEEKSVHQEGLNNDSFFEVLSRLPTKYMPRLKCVSKGWNHIISDPAFMKVQSKKREPLSGFFIQQKYRWAQYDIPTISYIPVERQHADIHQTVFEFLPEDVVVLASCNGLVCCRSCLPFEDPCLYICNPLNKEWIKVKWDVPNKETSFALGFDPCQDSRASSTNFKFIKAEQFETVAEELYVSFEIYSSDTGFWKKSEETCKFNSNLYKNKGIFVEGFFYWLTDAYEVLCFDVENEMSCLASVPLPASEFGSIPEACIGDSDGRLHYILVSEYGLQVWLLEVYFESAWSLKLSKTLEEMEEEQSEFFCNLRERVTQRLAVDKEPWIDPLAFKDGYLLMRRSRQILLYNIETNKMQHVCEVSSLGTASIFFTVLPYSLSLVHLNQA